MRSLTLATFALLALTVNAYHPHYPPPVDCPAICDSSRCPDRGPPHSHPKCIKNECKYACDRGYELEGKYCVAKKCHPRDCYDKIPTHAYPVCTNNACSFECKSGYIVSKDKKHCIPYYPTTTAKPSHTYSTSKTTTKPHSPTYPTTTSCATATTYTTSKTTSKPTSVCTPTYSSSTTWAETSTISAINAPSALPTATSRPEQLRLDPCFEITDVPTERDFYWTIEEMIGAPDGFERVMWVVNGQIEGPLIEANQGDTINVHIKNNLVNGTAIHWHGLAQNGTVWADGPNGATQCPIPSGQTFTYRFKLDREDQYGSYWWHAHRGATYADGITGPLIIHSVNDPLKRGEDYDIDQVLMIRDQFHTLSDIIVAGLRSPQGFDGSIAAPSPKSGLINGHGVYNCSAPAAANATCTQQAPLEIEFPPNQRVRLRMINMGTHALFKVSVDEHELSVIEADDTPTNAAVVHRVFVNIAQRYSAVFNTSNDVSGDSFFLRAQMNTGCFGAPINELDPQALAIIRIVDEGESPSTDTPTSVDWGDEVNGACIDLDDSLLVPRIPIDAPVDVDERSVFNSSLRANDAGFRWTLNNVSFDAFTYNPLLFQLARGETLDPAVIANIVADSVQVHDIIINNVAGADHPFHLHLLKMFIVARGPGVLTTEAAAGLTYNTTNPLRRDTLNVSPGTHVVVRVITDIPGVAAFHCHIAWHQAAGLFGALVVQPHRITFADIPQEAQALCDAGNIIPGENINTTEPARRLMRKRLELGAVPIYQGLS